MEETQEGDWSVSPDLAEIELNTRQLRLAHVTVKKVTEDIESFDFNTAISQMMIFTNEFVNSRPRPVAGLRTLLPLLSPFAPHMAEELWEALGHENTTLAYENWPKFDPALAREDTIEIPVQVNGKLRAKVPVAAEADAKTLEAAARADERIAELLAGKVIVKAVVVPGRLVNFVIKG